MTENATNQTTTQAAPSIEWLYCFACNMSQLMTLLRMVDVHAVYLCPNCHTERYVLR